MIRVRVRNSRSRERLRDRDAGLRDRPRGIALTGMFALKLAQNERESIKIYKNE